MSDNENARLQSLEEERQAFIDSISSEAELRRWGRFAALERQRAELIASMNWRIQEGELERLVRERDEAVATARRLESELKAANRGLKKIESAVKDIVIALS